MGHVSIRNELITLLKRKVPDFNTALALGMRAEELFLSRLRLHYPHAMKVEGSFKQFDFYIPDIDSKVELKTDIKSNETGNFVVETFHYGKPSGITTTTADFWVFNDDEYYYWVDPDVIKNMILITGIQQARFVGNGDDTEKRAYLIPKGWIIDKASLKWNVKEEGQL
jgi:hypothetical protein